MVPGGYPVDSVGVELAPQRAHIVHGHILLADVCTERQPHVVRVLSCCAMRRQETVYALACGLSAPNSSVELSNAK